MSLLTSTKEKGLTCQISRRHNTYTRMNCIAGPKTLINGLHCELPSGWYLRVRGGGSSSLWCARRQCVDRGRAHHMCTRAAVPDFRQAAKGSRYLQRRPRGTDGTQMPESNPPLYCQGDRTLQGLSLNGIKWEWKRLIGTHVLTVLRHLILSVDLVILLR
jgi:hypothetical protein